MAQEKNYGLLISAMVAMVAIVGLVVLLKGGSTGGFTAIESSGHSSFGRSYGSSGSGFAGDRVPCYYAAEEGIVCPGVDASGKTFGAPSKWREGNEPAVIYYESGRGFVS